MDTLTQALQAARYGEIVELQVEHDTVYLAASLDVEHGGILWQPIDPSTRWARHLRTKQWILPMLNDQPRNQYYQQAIRLAAEELRIRHVPDNPSEPMRVLDIGAGSGLLSLMAAQHIPRARTDALEMATSMADLARQVVDANGTNDGQIIIHTRHSTEHETNQRAHLCVSELLENGLLGEGVLVALRDAWDRLLRPDAVIVPQRARVCVAAVQGAWIQSLLGPHRTERDKGEISFSLGQNHESLMLEASRVVYPVQAHHVFREGGDGTVLTDGKQALALSFEREALLLERNDSQSRVTLTSSQPGTVHGFLVWWELNLWAGVTYSLRPGAEPFQDHWKACIHPCQHSIPVQTGDTLTVQVSHNHHRLFVSVCDTASDAVADTKRQRRSNSVEEDGACLISPDRALQLNDPHRLDCYTRAIQEALAVKGTQSSILDLSDFSLCACIAARACGAKRVLSLESSSGDIPMTSARMCQLGNSLPLEGASFEILQCHGEQLTMDLIGGKPIDIAVAEPYYQALEGWHLQEAFNYFCLLRSLRRRELLADDMIAVPATCRIMACGIQSEQIRSAYRPCGDADGDGFVCGFDHSVINQHAGNFESYDLPLPIWQYDYIPITAEAEIGLLDYCKLSDGPVKAEATMSVTRKGTLDAILVWVEYTFGSSETSIGVLRLRESKGTRQLLRRMNHSREVDVTETVSITVSFLSQPNEDEFRVVVS